MEWVSVKDRLPEADQKVLVFSGGQYFEVKYYIPRKDAWYPGGLPIGNSSHWMPLPDPPKRTIVLHIKP